MSRVCNECGKGPKKAAIRSHAKNKTLRTQDVNLQKLNGELMCTRCRKTKVNKMNVTA